MENPQRRVRFLSFVNLVVISIMFGPDFLGRDYPDAIHWYIQIPGVLWLLGTSLYILIIPTRQGLADMRDRHAQENRELAERTSQRRSGY